MTFATKVTALQDYEDAALALAKARVRLVLAEKELTAAKEAFNRAKTTENEALNAITGTTTR